MAVGWQGIEIRVEPAYIAIACAHGVFAMPEQVGVDHLDKGVQHGRIVGRVERKFHPAAHSPVGNIGDLIGQGGIAFSERIVGSRHGPEVELCRLAAALVDVKKVIFTT